MWRNGQSCWLTGYDGLVFGVQVSLPCGPPDNPGGAGHSEKESDEFYVCGKTWTFDVQYLQYTTV